MSFRRPRTFEEAKANHKPLRRQTAALRSGTGLKRSQMKKARKRDPLHDEWREQVLERDGYQCRWIEQGKRCGVRGTPENSTHLHAHHINERSQRPDLRYDIANGATLCGGPGRHHDRIHHTVKGRKRGRELGLLGGETYEKANRQIATTPRPTSGPVGE